MKKRRDIEEMRVYKDMDDYIKARNCKPKLNIMDKEASTAVKRYIINANVNYQLVEPNNHRVNTAERAIHTLKIILWQDYRLCTQNFLCIYGMNYSHKHLLP